MEKDQFIGAILSDAYDVLAGVTAMDREIEKSAQWNSDTQNWSVSYRNFRCTNRSLVLSIDNLLKLIEKTNRENNK